MNKITEIIPNDLPEWAVDAMAEGQLFNVTFARIRQLEETITCVLDVHTSLSRTVDTVSDMFLGAELERHVSRMGVLLAGDAKTDDLTGV